jgi:hypothetical protein
MSRYNPEYIIRGCQRIESDAQEEADNEKRRIIPYSPWYDMFHFSELFLVRNILVALCGVVAIVLAILPKVCGFKLCLGRWLLRGDKNP